ncbi:MAG: DUF3189 family protein [Bacillota bacterium]
MKIMYFCPTGVHASVVAAGVHLGMIDSTGNMKKVASLPHYNSISPGDYGPPIYMGTDEMGSEVYTLPTGGEQAVATKAVRSFMRIFGLPDNELYLVDAFKYNNLWMHAGILFSQIGLRWLGGRIFALSLRGIMPKYAAMAGTAKEEIRSGQALGMT